MELGVREEDNLAILSLKKSRKDWARHDVEMEVESIVGCNIFWPIRYLANEKGLWACTIND